MADIASHFSALERSNLNSIFNLDKDQNLLDLKKKASLHCMILDIYEKSIPFDWFNKNASLHCMMRDIYENLLNLGFEDLIGSKLGTPN